MPFKDFIKKRASQVLKMVEIFFCYDCKQLSEIILYLNEFKFNLESLQFVHPKVQKRLLW